MRIMVRHAEDDFKAMQIAQGMENAGANVFSITSDGQSKYPNATLSHSRYTVWAKVADDKMISKVDDEIGKEMG